MLPVSFHKILRGKLLAARRSVVRIALILVIASGILCTVYYNSRLSSVRRTHTDLRARVGLFDFGDSGKVQIVRTRVPDEFSATGINKAIVWRFRLSLPANYGFCCNTNIGLVKSNAPGGTGGATTNFGSANANASEVDVAISFIELNEEWLVSVRHTTGSGSQSLPKSFPIDCIEDLVVEPVVDYGVTRTFDGVDAICLLRIREKNFAVSNTGKGKKDLYRGCSVYCFSIEHQDAFFAFQRGEISSMKEAGK